MKFCEMSGILHFSHVKAEMFGPDVLFLLGLGNLWLQYH